MIHATLGEIAEAIGGHVIGDRDLAIRGVGIDTRDDLSGRLFVAIHGERHDGHDHLEGAAVSGAVASLVDRVWLDRGGDAGGLPLVAVDDTVLALGRLAAIHRDRLKGRVIGVTGSAGKTTTRALLEAVLAPAGPGTASIRSFNNHIGVPLTLARRLAGRRLGGAGDGHEPSREIARLVETARPEIAIITGTGRAHLEGPRRRVRGRPREGDDPRRCRGGHRERRSPAILTELERRLDASTTILTYGLSDRAGTRGFSNERRVSRGAADPPRGTSRATSRLDGSHNAANAVAAMLVARRLGVADASIAAALATAIAAGDAIRPP